jgi:ribosome-associated translation inhibitor RaiA
MQLPVDITFRDMAPSDAVAAAIHSWATRLEPLHRRIVRCAVVVEQPHHHHRRGNLFHVHAALTVPGGEIVSHSAPDENVYVAISDTFRTARRQLQERARRARSS